MTDYDVVDLGTKQGNAMEEFLNKAGNMYLDPAVIKRLDRSRCVGFERKEGEKYRSDLAKKGFKLAIANLATDSAIAELPTSQVYLAWHFLEHLPTKEWSSKVVHAALTKSTLMAWFRLPSFEQDEIQGEGVLRKLGLRFSWTHWHGHTSHWTVDDCLGAITTWEQTQSRKFRVTVRPAGYIKATDDKRVVPIGTPIDVNAYAPIHGHKPKVKFKKWIVSEWEVIVRFTCE